MFDKIIDFINNYGIYFLFCLLVISIEDEATHSRDFSHELVATYIK